MTTLAIFDLDKTLISNDSDYHWGAFLAENGYVDAEFYQSRNEFFYQQYAAGTLDIFEYSEFVFDVLARTPMETLLAWRAEFVAQKIMPMVLPQAQALVQKHLDAGHQCVLISATNEFVIEPIARLFGFEHIIGTTPECVEGRFTGKVAGVPSFQMGKITRLEAWMKHQNLAWSDVNMSFFYSDSANDLPLLERVGMPIACNPDARLRELALVRHWPILELFVETKL